jgi:1,4-dihydroxy-2-naphthoate octaprenyltransferase/chlorophyll synthase
MSTSLSDDELPSSKADRWLYALKPASWPKLIVPALFGQLLAASAVGHLKVGAFVWGLGFTVFGLAFIVLLNDWGDREVDAIKRHMFPDGCSPKTIPDGILGARSVGVAGLACGLLAAILAFGAEASLDRDFAFEAGLGCMFLFLAYTLPPIRLNYRGGGELLEMLGVGLALPLYNAYLQAGGSVARVWIWVAGFAVLSLGSGIASGLSDEQSDRAGGKRTFASMFGNAFARRLTEACVIVGATIWAVAAIWRPDWVPVWAAVPAIAIIAWNFAAMKRVSDEAVTNAFSAQSRYKHFLHRAIWHSTTVAAVLLWLQSSLA